MRVVVDDKDLHLTAYVSGNGPLVVCHPSFGRWSRDFEPVVDALIEAGHRVALFDPRGVGESTGPIETASMHDLAADLLRIARYLAPPPYDLIGHAFGNRVVRCAAADAGTDVRRVALLAAGGAIAGPPEAHAALMRAMDLTLARPERLAALRESLFSPKSDPTSWLDGWYPPAAAAQRSARERTPLAEWHDAGTAKVLIVQGLDDVLAPPENGRQLAARLGERAHLVEIADAGHALLPEQPRAIADALVPFLA